MLRRRIEDHGNNNFFLSTTGQPVTKIFDQINRTMKKMKVKGADGKYVAVSATTFRKLVETAGRSCGPDTGKGLARALQHSEFTASRHYVLHGKEDALRRQALIRKVDHTAMVHQFIKEK